MRRRPDLALFRYEKARASRRQSDFDALLGDCYADLQLDDLAREAFQSANLYQPDQPEGGIGLCQLKLAEGDFGGAREICQRELPHYATSPAATQVEALIEFFAHDFSTAGHCTCASRRPAPTVEAVQPFLAPVDFASAPARLEIEDGDSRSGGGAGRSEATKTPRS